MNALIEIPELGKIGKGKWMKSIYTELQIQEIEQVIEHHVWITANRKQVYVSSMSINHIQNCIRCWEGNGKSKIPENYLGGKSKWLKIFYKELSKRN